MLTGQVRSQIDKIWDAFWSGGISNPLEVIEQITYLLFLRRLDDLETLEENKASRLGEPMTRRFYPEGKDALDRPYEQLRWSRFKNEAPAEMFAIVRDSVFPFLRNLGSDGTTFAHHMEGARFTIPTPALLAKVVDLIDDVPMADRDTKGDLYEYMLGKIATAGQNGQFRTPRHIIALMVEMTAPQPTDTICDPACGTAGFLVTAGEYLRRENPNLLHDTKLRRHFHENLFHGFDFDNTMLRIGSMNMLLHGVENPDIRYRDSLAQDHTSDAEAYSLVMSVALVPSANMSARTHPRRAPLASRTGRVRTANTAFIARRAPISCGVLAVAVFDTRRRIIPVKRGAFEVRPRGVKSQNSESEMAPPPQNLRTPASPSVRVSSTTTRAAIRQPRVKHVVKLSSPKVRGVLLRSAARGST
jgi:N-6 DNA Methylase/HsdM N-terminal domain